jgi:cytochrome P450
MPALDVFGESMNVVGAGADTTAISVRAILRYVCSNPRVLKKLQAEIDNATSKGALSDLPKFAEGSALPYFQAVIKEALRIYPAGTYYDPYLRILINIRSLKLDINFHDSCLTGELKSMGSFFPEM